MEGWDYKPNELSVRKVMGIDGKVKIQLRVDLGLLQMEWAGRPDGKTPYGKESLLHYYLPLIEEHERKYGSTENFKLNTEDCVKLQMEALQYYHRRICFLELEEYERAKEDAEHNLKIMDLVKHYAEDDRDKLALNQYRPFVTMHRVRAEALIALRKKDYEQAIRTIREGIEEIEQFFRDYEREDLIEESVEIRFLRDWSDEISQSRPLGLREQLQQELQLAVDREDYELAARIRDRIRQMGEHEA
jgi:tetratricopeptide (TPR) repeat protein